mmetsp:Transcript_17895/g.36074  ORF Transcript_17895/g.36074 Transcript_17895/m.36074 type:complete len:128 (+) Transcript_17895:2607-2990(+)
MYPWLYPLAEEGIFHGIPYPQEVIKGQGNVVGKAREHPLIHHGTERTGGVIPNDPKVVARLTGHYEGCQAHVNCIQQVKRTHDEEDAPKRRRWKPAAAATAVATAAASALSTAAAAFHGSFHAQPDQ